MRKIIILILVSFIQISCGQETELCIFTSEGCPERDSRNNTEEESVNNSVSPLGERTNSLEFTGDGYDYLEDVKNAEVIIHSYTQGAEIKITSTSSSSPPFICQSENSITQGGTQKSFRITDTKSDFDRYDYHGYPSTDGQTTCGYLFGSVTYYLFLEKLSFDPLQDYSLTIDGIDAQGSLNSVVFNINP